jgi:hypothetical protein
MDPVVTTQQRAIQVGRKQLHRITVEDPDDFARLRPARVSVGAHRSSCRYYDSFAFNLLELDIQFRLGLRRRAEWAGRFP